MSNDKVTHTSAAGNPQSDQKVDTSSAADQPEVYLRTTATIQAMRAAIYAHPDLAPGAKLFCLMLLEITGKHWETWMSPEKLAKRQGCSMRTLRYRIQAARRGAVWIEKCKKGHKLPNGTRSWQNRNIYVLNPVFFGLAIAQSKDEDCTPLESAESTPTNTRSPLSLPVYVFPSCAQAREVPQKPTDVESSAGAPGCKYIPPSQRDEIGVPRGVAEAIAASQSTDPQVPPARPAQPPGQRKPAAPAYHRQTQDPLTVAIQALASKKISQEMYVQIVADVKQVTADKRETVMMWLQHDQNIKDHRARGKDWAQDKGEQGTDAPWVAPEIMRDLVDAVANPQALADTKLDTLNATPTHKPSPAMLVATVRPAVPPVPWPALTDQSWRCAANQADAAKRAICQYYSEHLRTSWSLAVAPATQACAEQYDNNWIAMAQALADNHGTGARKK